MFNIYNVVKNTGATYKSIYANGTPLIESAKKALHDKYVGIEKKVYQYGKDVQAGKVASDDIVYNTMSIAYHGTSFGCLSGKNAHLKFDSVYPVIHLISYQTDVADYNIKTGFCFEGETYSMTTSKQLGDFNYLFEPYNKAKVDKYTGIIHNFDIIKEGHTPILNLAKDGSWLGLIDTLAQYPLFDKLFVAIDNAKCYKYQEKQMTEIIVNIASSLGSKYAGFDVYEYGLYNHVNDTIPLDVFNTYLDGGITLDQAINRVNINKHSVGTTKGGYPIMKERHIGNSLNILTGIVKGLVNEKAVSRE